MGSFSKAKLKKIKFRLCLEKLIGTTCVDCYNKNSYKITEVINSYFSNANLKTKIPHKFQKEEA